MTAPYSGHNTRRNIISFMIGKIPNALATAALLAMLARSLGASDLGHYVVAMASIEIGLGLSTLGLDWILLRFLPEFRINASRRELVNLIVRVVAARCGILALLAAALWAGAGMIASVMADFPVALAAPVAVLLVAEGINRMLRDNCFEALAMQPSLQLCTLLRSAIMLGTLGLLGTASAEVALYAEVAASLSSLLLAAMLLYRSIRPLPQAGVSGWVRPAAPRMFKVALHNYASGIAEYLYSPSFLILILARFQSATTMAGLGFVLRLVDIIRNYMPGMVMFSVVRARMIGAYAANGDYHELQGWASFVYKISMLTLLPVVAVAAVYGEEVLQLISGGRFGEFHLLFAVLCGWLALRLHRLILNVVCNAIGLMGLWARAASCSLLLLPILLAFGAQRHNVWIVPLALVGNELIINAMVIAGMRTRGRRWPFGVRWWARAGLASVIACGVAWTLPGGGATALVLQVVALCAIYSVCVLAAGTIDSADKQLINRVAGRQLFPFPITQS